MDNLRTIWNLCWPIIFYGLLMDTVSLFFRDMGLLACTLIGAIAAVPFLWVIYVRGGDKAGKLSPASSFLCVAGGIGGCILVNTLIKVSRAARLFTGFSEVSAQMYESPLWLQICAMGVVVPAAEELVFRGLVFEKARKDWSFFRAAVMSALLFGIYHGNVLQGIYGFLMGVMFAWIMERKKTILAPVLMHMSANLTSVAVIMIESMR